VGYGGHHEITLRCPMDKPSERADEERTMLADIYGWFTEGFETADLKFAKSLLDGWNP
jgi:hypothetical protein